MAVMQWTEKMSVGVPELDGDHRQLIRVINQLGASYDDESRRNSVRQSLFALRRYAEFHFAREEKVMTVCGYPGIEEHRVEHRDFVTRIQDLGVEPFLIGAAVTLEGGGSFDTQGDDRCCQRCIAPALLYVGNKRTINLHLIHWQTLEVTQR